MKGVAIRLQRLSWAALGCNDKLAANLFHPRYAPLYFSGLPPLISPTSSIETK